MFFVPGLLTRKGPLSIVWLGAHLQRKLTKSQIQETNIKEIIDILNGQNGIKFSLRITCDLLVGVCYINKRQIEYMLEDVNRKFDQLIKLFNVDEGRKRMRRSIDLPDVRNETEDWTMTIEPIYDLDDFMRNFPPDEVPLNELEDDLTRRRRTVTMPPDLSNPAIGNEVHAAIPVVDNFGEYSVQPDEDFTNLTGGMSDRVPPDQYPLQMPEEVDMAELMTPPRMPQSPVDSDRSKRPAENDQLDDGSGQAKRPRIDIPDASPVAPVVPESPLRPVAEPLVLPPLNAQQIADEADRLRGRAGPARGGRRPAIVRRRPNLPQGIRIARDRQLIVDAEVRIPEEQFRLQLEQQPYQLMPDFAPNRPPLDGFETIFHQPLRRLPVMLMPIYNQAIEAARNAEPLFELGLPMVGERQPTPLILEDMQMDVDVEQQNLPPPHDQQLPTEYDDMEFFAEPIPPVPENIPAASTRSLSVMSTPPQDLQRHNVTDHRQSDFNIDNEVMHRTLNDSMIRVATYRQLTFPQFIHPHNDRKTAVIMFISLLRKRHEGEVFLEQQPSFEKFNVINISLAEAEDLSPEI